MNWWWRSVSEANLFRARAIWQGLDDGIGSISAEGFDARIALPKEFGGTNSGTNAEELLLSALGSCLTMTLAFILEKGIGETPVIEANVEGRFTTGPLRLDSVSVNLSIGPTSADSSEVEEAVRRAEARCMVSNVIRLSAPIDVRATVVPGT